MDRGMTAVCAVALLAAGAVILVKLGRNQPAPAAAPVEELASHTPHPEAVPEFSPPSPAPVAEVIQPPPVEPPPVVERKVDLRPYTTVTKGEENPDAIPYGTAGFVLFGRYKSLVSRYPDRGMETLQRELGVNEETATRFVEYIRSADEELLARRKSAREEYCSRRDSILTLEDVIRESQKLNDVVHAVRIEIVKNADSVLGPEGMAKLEEQVSKERRAITRTSIDKSQAFYALGRTPEELMKQMCDSPIDVASGDNSK